MPAEDFLATHWQKSPLFMPGAVDVVSPSLEPAELAWLATQDDVESVLIFTEYRGNDTTYRVESGPFDDEMLSLLPERDWTLLVQDVDKHLPDFRRLLALAAFIPDWRIDDLMISFAAPGGSAGPHKDNYDVFLCQGSGHREWRLTDPDLASASDSCEQLSLLRPFTDPAPLQTKKGDVLYLPPGVPHWGIASDACMTYSIGMRAPALGELRLCFEREFPDDTNPFPQDPDENGVFYADPDLLYAESLPGQISAESVNRCRDLVGETASVTDKWLAITLGCVATDLKAWLSPDSPSADEVSKFLHAEEWRHATPVHGMARIAWWAGDHELIVFANGRHKSVAFQHLNFMQALCATRELGEKPAQTHNLDELVAWLLNVGVFDLFADDDESATGA
jgi:50S ribosomal protein L16 3-hydroxylase